MLQQEGGIPVFLLSVCVPLHRGWKPGFTLRISSNTGWGKVELLPWISIYSALRACSMLPNVSNDLELRNDDLQSESLFLVLSIFNITA